MRLKSLLRISHGHAVAMEMIQMYRLYDTLQNRLNRNPMFLF